MDITVEDATNAWLSCINNNSKKKRIRSAVRGLKMRRMLKILSAVNANSPEGFMEAFISRIMKDDEVMNQAPIPTNLEVDFGRAVRTGETEKYDKKIDAMMSKLSKKKA
jgi:hypothetical protein